MRHDAVQFRVEIKTEQCCSVERLVNANFERKYSAIAFQGIHWRYLNQKLTQKSLIKAMLDLFRFWKFSVDEEIVQTSLILRRECAHNVHFEVQYSNKRQQVLPEGSSKVNNEYRKTSDITGNIFINVICTEVA